MNKFVGLGIAATLVLGFSSCKPKQSAYKSVYEAAQERSVESNATQPAQTPVYPVYTSPESTDNSNVRVTSEKVTAIDPADASGLKAYSVVIATLSVRPNALALRSKMQNEGYPIIIAQNQQGMYRVIAASYDNKSDAIAKRNEIARKYKAMGDTEALRKTYGIPFNDLWILQQKY